MSEERLRDLNEICKQCMERRRKNFDPMPDPVEECANICPTGIEIHSLDKGSEWDKVDWNSARYEQLYRH